MRAAIYLQKWIEIDPTSDAIDGRNRHRQHGNHITLQWPRELFSVFKRGLKGVYQHCKEKHLQRYLTEFYFHYNRRDLTDSERSNEALKGIEGKRLTYRRTPVGAHV